MVSSGALERANWAEKNDDIKKLVTIIIMPL